MNTTPSSPPSADWSARAELLRLQQWETYQRLREAAEALLHQVRLFPDVATPALRRDANQLTQLAFKLGRQATGLDLKKEEPGPTGPPPLSPELQAEVDRIYAEPPAAPPTAAPSAPPPKPPATSTAAPAPSPQPSTLNPQPTHSPPGPTSVATQALHQTQYRIAHSVLVSED